MSEAADQRFAPPQAHVADLAPGEMELAGRGMRLLAVVVDAIILFGVSWAVMRIPFLQPLVKAQEARMGVLSLNLLSAAIGVAVFLVVQGWPLLTRGQTIGKILFKLRIVRSDGSRPDAWRLLGLRYGIGAVMNINAVSSMVFGLIDSLLIFRDSRKCLHDSIADTRVVKV